MSADVQPIGSVFKLFAVGGNESVYDAVEINGAAGVSLRPPLASRPRLSFCELGKSPHDVDARCHETIRTQEKSR